MIRLSLIGIRVQILSSRGKSGCPAMRSSVDDLPADSEPMTTMVGSLTRASMLKRWVTLMMRP